MTKFKFNTSTSSNIDKVIKADNNTVEVLDSIMGGGKTTGILQWIENNPNEKYIYVSPLLSEVQEGGRIHEHLSRVTFEVPSNFEGSKSTNFLELLKEGSNIACTHSLYLLMKDEHFEAMENNEYIVIIDEEINVVGSFDKYSKQDLEWLLERGEVEVTEKDGMVSWVGNPVESGHKYYNMMKYCDSNSLYATLRSDTMMVTQLPVKLFKCAKRVVILTYMFDNNVLDCFLRVKGFDIKVFDGVKANDVDMEEIRNLITLIPPNEKIQKYSLSSSWYSAKATSNDLKVVSDYIRSSCMKAKVLSDEVLWCVPKAYSEKTRSNAKVVSPRGYRVDSNKETCFLSANVRATNNYAHKKMMVHCYNRYCHVAVTAYLADYGHPVDNNVFALSEMLQWSWRGCIRNNEPMTLAIGSKRMYNLMEEWINRE